MPRLAAIHKIISQDHFANDIPPLPRSIYHPHRTPQWFPTCNDVLRIHECLLYDLQLELYATFPGLGSGYMSRPLQQCLLCFVPRETRTHHI